MRYGLTLPNGGPCGDAKSLGELARLAEETGWDGVFIEDTLLHFSGPTAPTFDPWIALAAMAMNTSRIRLGTTVTPLPRRRPWKLARETATLDILSNGRLILGVGLGELSDLTPFGEITDNVMRARMLDEALDVLVGLWSGQPFSYQGKHYHVAEVTFLPTPVQKPRIPIWVGGGYGRVGPMKRAARWDGAAMFPITGNNWTFEEIQALTTYMRDHHPATTPYDIVVSGQERTADVEQGRALVASYAQAGATWWFEYVHAAEFAVMQKHIAQGPLRID